MTKYANFNFLVYIAKILDIETAENFGKQIVEENIDGETMDALLDSVLGYK